jgi:topoisomerase-4 subunit A
MEINAEEFISVKGFRAFGNQLTDKKIKKISLKEALNYELPVEQDVKEIEVEGEEAINSENDDSQISLNF